MNFDLKCKSTLPFQDMPYCLYIGAGLGGLAFLLIALNVIWWKCALRPIHTKKTPLYFPRQPTVQTITNSYPFRYFWVGSVNCGLYFDLYVSKCYIANQLNTNSFQFRPSSIMPTLVILLQWSDSAFNYLYLAVYSYFQVLHLRNTFKWSFINVFHKWGRSGSWIYCKTRKWCWSVFNCRAQYRH